MKQLTTSTWLLLICVAFIVSCYSKSEKKTELNTVQNTIYDLSISVTKMENSNAPALQSFAHAVYNDYWILFSGRTNHTADDGGIHNMNKKSNYTTTAFVPESFNTNLYLYEHKKDILTTMPLDSVVTYLQQNLSNGGSNGPGSSYFKNLAQYIYKLRCTNPLVTQKGDFMFIIGGYGTDIDKTTDASNYQTFNTVTRIHLPSLVNLFKGKPITDWANFYRVGSNDMLKSTGGEVHMKDSTLYLCGGHNFGKGANNGQQYVDAVIPFSVANNPTNNFILDVTMGTPITDVPIDSLGTVYADKHSAFRRRDGPMVPILVQKRTGYTEGVAFYGGVFKPGFPLKAWNDALYVIPDQNILNNQLVNQKLDTVYNQNNFNVYSCPDFAVTAFGINGVLNLHTFLPGGIGDGLSDGNLSGFTNTYTQAILNTQSLTSVARINRNNLFNSTSFYGAEAAYMPSKDSSIKYFSSTSGKTEFIDANNTFSNQGGSIDIGYIYGGIEAFQKSPAKSPSSGFGPSRSCASNTVWKVTLKAVTK